MKNYVIIGLVLALLVSGCSRLRSLDENFNVNTTTVTESLGAYCIKNETGESMGFAEAVSIAKAACGNRLKPEHFCNEITGTWWIDLDVQEEGCNPACVVNVVDKTSEINWRCTGLLPP